MSQKNQFSGPIWPFRNTSIKTVADLMHHLACHQWWKFQTKFTTLGYSRKIQTVSYWIYFSENPRGNLDLLLYPKKFQKKKQAFTPGNFAKLCYTPWKFQGQNQRSIEIARFFLVHPWKFHFFFNWPLEFPNVLSPIPLEIPCP